MINVNNPLYRLILIIARRTLGSELKKDMVRIISAGIDWDIFCSQIEMHRLASLSYFHISSLDEETKAKVPMWVRFYLFLENRKSLIGNRYLLKGLAHVSDILDGYGIEAISLKGPTLYQVLYDDISLRQSRDIDILVKADELNVAVSVLNLNGFLQYFRDGCSNQPVYLPQSINNWCKRVHNHLYPLFYRLPVDLDNPEELISKFLDEDIDNSFTYEELMADDRSYRNWYQYLGWTLQLTAARDGVCLELHYSPFIPTAPYKINLNEWFASAVKVSVLDQYSIRTLSPAYNFLFLCEHLYKEAASYYSIRNRADLRLIKFSDIYQFIKRNADAVREAVEVAEAFNMERPIIYCLHYVNEIYDLQKEKHIFEGIRRDDSSFLDQFFEVYYGSKTLDWLSPFSDRLFDMDRHIEAHSIASSNREKNRYIFCNKLGRSIDFGAMLDSPEWKKIKAIELTDQIGLEPQKLQTRTVAEEAEGDFAAQCKLKAILQTAWDDQYLYFIIKVQNQSEVTSDSDYYLYNQDAVKLYFDAAQDDKREIYLLPRINHINGAIAFSQSKRGHKIFKSELKELLIKSNITKDGYIVKAGIPIHYLSIEPIAGTQIQFGIEVFDCANATEGVTQIVKWKGEDHSNFNNGQLVLN